MSNAQEARGFRKTREGIVTSDKMDKSVVILIQDREKHGLYGKVLSRSRKLKAHDENNTAGIGDPNGNARFLDASFDGFHKVIDVNLLGVIWGSQCAARHMKDHGGGSIINTASIAGTRPGHGVFTYRAAKAGVINFTQSIAMDLGEYLIRCNIICPGNIPSEIGVYNAPGASPEVAQRVRDAVKKVRMDRQPLKSQGEGIDIANAALFLGSDRSKQITGLIMPVDAGATAGDHADLGTKIREAREAVLAG